MSINLDPTDNRYLSFKEDEFITAINKMNERLKELEEEHKRRTVEFLRGKTIIVGSKSLKEQLEADERFICAEVNFNPFCEPDKVLIVDTFKLEDFLLE